MNEEILREIIKQDYAKIRQDIQSFLKNKVQEKNPMELFLVLVAE